MLIGKKIIIGISHLDHNGKLLNQEEYNGVIESISESNGVQVRCDGLEHCFTMPPQTHHFIKAPPGTYTEIKSKNLVEDPDYLCAWEVTWPVDKSENPKWKPVALERRLLEHEL